MRNYRYAVERTMRILGGWIALTPEISAKLLMGRHVWDLAQHADALGRRLPELRAQAHVSAPANDGFVAFLDAIDAAERPEQTVERLTGIYGVLKPHLLASYMTHMERVNEVYEPPTRRILARCVEDERRHIGAGLVVVRHLTTTPVLESRASAWRTRIESERMAHPDREPSGCLWRCRRSRASSRGGRRLRSSVCPVERRREGIH